MRRIVLCAATLTLLVPLGAATARPLPPLPLVVDKYVMASIDIAYVPGTGFTVATGGDALLAYSCTSDLAPNRAAVTCRQDAGKSYRLVCNIVDIDAYGVFVQSLTPRVLADSHCSDSTGGVAAALDTAVSSHTHVQHLRRVADELLCAVRPEEVSSVPFHTRCTFAGSPRQPIIGSIVMWQNVGMPWFTATVGGVLLTDFTCAQSLSSPPTVTCHRNDPAIQWYCDDTIVQAIVANPLAAGVPQVNGQLLCANPPNTTLGPVPSTGPTAPPGTNPLSTADVPTSASLTDASTATMNYDAEYFICQARGPLDISLPVPPWKVECAEP